MTKVIARRMTRQDFTFERKLYGLILYGLEGLYLHVAVWMVQNGSYLREIWTSLRGGWGKFSSEQEPKVVLVDVLNAVILF